MNYQKGQFIAGVISVSIQIIHLWSKEPEIGLIRNRLNQFCVIASSAEVISDGKQLEKFLNPSDLDKLKNKLETIFQELTNAIRDPTLKAIEFNFYVEGLRLGICQELKTIKSQYGSIPIPSMQDWDEFKCETTP